MINVVITGLLLGIGLAMDAFAVSVSDGLKDGKMSIKKGVFIASIFAIFQAIMPLSGYLLGHAFIKYIEKVIPYIALVLLGFLGIKMIVEICCVCHFSLMKFCCKCVSFVDLKIE